MVKLKEIRNVKLKCEICGDVENVRELVFIRSDGVEITGLPLCNAHVGILKDELSKM